MACFTKTQQSNGRNWEFENYVTTSKFFVLNTLNKCHCNSVRAQYVCDKSENARVCQKWQWNALDWCYWIALPASPVVQSSNTVSCVSLSFCTHPCVLAIETHDSGVTKCTTGEAWSAFSWHHSSVFHCQWTHNQVFLLLSHNLKCKKYVHLCDEICVWFHLKVWN